MTFFIKNNIQVESLGCVIYLTLDPSDRQISRIFTCCETNLINAVNIGSSSKIFLAKEVHSTYKYL